MTQFLQIVAPLMAIVSFFLIFAGVAPSLRQSKAFHFLCGESAFITAVAYGALAVLGVSWFDPVVVVIWFVVGSVKFAHSTWFDS